MAKELQRIQKLRADLRAKSAPELVTELVELRKSQFALRLQRATGQGAKPNQFSKTRRDIARLKTVQREQRGKTGGK
ncbi:MAG: 50S ribosomal protein L29 [Steroidobacteraceae bacterium]